MIQPLSKTTEATKDIAPGRPYYPALDGLRGLAILLVVFLHNFGFMKYFFFGWLGVDLFFVLSGFLITTILLDSVGKPGYLKNFYIRRVLRIFPVYYFTILFCLFIVPLISHPPVNIIYYRENAIWLVTFLQNWLYVFHPPQGSSILLHFWSLGVEEQFYLFWPCVILLVRKPARLFWILITVLLFVMIGRFVLWTFHIENLAYDTLYTFTRIDGICVGGLIAILMRTRPTFLKNYMTIIVLALAALNFLMYFLNKNASTRLPYLAFVGYTTFAIMFGFLLYECIAGNSKMTGLLFGNRLMRFFGKISYGLYVYHWPLYLLLTPLLQDLYNRVSTKAQYSLFVSSVAATFIAIAISFLSYRYFESYFLKMKNRFA